jgi:predicted AlkP superfamily pyrophosphatase or phosphodiesterase
MITLCWAAALMLSACSTPKPAAEAAADTSEAHSETGRPNNNGSETGTADDTGSACPPPPWKTSSAGEPVALGSGEGVSVAERARAEALSGVILEGQSTAAVFWRQEDTDRYTVMTGDGSFEFSQERDAEGDRVLAWDEVSPLLDIPFMDTRLEEELSYGNPSETSYPESSYAPGDPRLSFPEIAQTSYPRLMRRIAQIFDGPNAPDLAIADASWANSGLGSHGGMDLYQSRSPLIFRGPGVMPGSYELAADQVDIAPTVAGLIGVDPVRGIDGSRGRWVDGQMLKWQDGRVLDEILRPSCTHGAAPRAVVIILDGMSHTELLEGVAAGRTPNIARIVDDSAAILDGGAIAGWPTFSLPGHASVLTGAYQGHHGLLSNSFLDRSSGIVVPSVSLDEALLDPERGAAELNSLMSPEVETLFEAVLRTQPEATAANINELTFRGANWSRLLPSGPPPPSLDDYLRYSLADQSAVIQAGLLFEEVGPPEFLALSLYLTDATGEGRGPHGDLLREAMVQTDERIGQILDLYTAADAFEDTLWVLTSDHGMAMQDNARTSDWSSRASEAGIGFSHRARMVVLD